MMVFNWELLAIPAAELLAASAICCEALMLTHLKTHVYIGIKFYTDVYVRF